MRRHPVTGQIAHGIAGDGVYVDGKQVAPGGGENGMPDWLGPDPIWCGTSGKPFAVVRGSQVGAWAGWTSLGGVTINHPDGTVLRLAKAVLFDSTDDGTVLVGDDYQSGNGISAYKAGATTPTWRVATARPEMRFPYAQAAILDAQTACWTENQNGRMVLVGYGLPAGPRPPWNVLHPRLFRVNGDVWVVYLRSEDDRTIAHPWDYRGLGFSVPGFGYGPEAWQDAQFVTIAWSIGAGERANDIKGQTFNLAALETIPSLPPPPRKIGALGPSLPKGTDVDFVSFLLRNGEPDARCWPRGDKSRGDTHGADFQRVTAADVKPVHQIDPATQDLFWSAVFDRDGQGECGGLMSIDKDPDGWVHHHADANNARIPEDAESAVGKGPFVDTWTDTRWARKRWKIGRQHGFTVNCQLQKWHPKTGKLLGTVDFQKEQWIEAVQPWYGGEDAGEGICLTAVYDNTGSGIVRNPELHVERDRYFIGNDGRVWGRVSWDTNESDDVFNTDGTHQFPAPEKSKAISDFYRLGGQRFPVRLPNVPMPRVILEEKPVSVPLPSAVQATMGAVVGAFGLPQGNPEAVKVLSSRVAEQVAFSHNAPGVEWGLKSTSPGSPISNNITRRSGQKLETWDWITGSAGPTPSLNIAGAEYFDVSAKPDGTPAQNFIPVTPTNHLATQKPRPGRATWPANIKHGVSGFDVAARVHGGDFAYYNLTAPLPLNVFVYTTIDNPQTHRLGRTFAQGLVQMETLLKKAVADGRLIMPIMICGPMWENNGPKPTRAEILNAVRQQIALFLRYPTAILAVCLGNELFQGFEPPELLDPTLQAEVEALVPLQFPFAIGQVSDAVVYGPGSVAMMHPDRGKGSAEALQILADARARDGRTVVAREPARIEAGGAGQSRGDINFVREELANAKRLNIPYFLHLAAGRGCYVPAMDDVQRQALDLIKAEAGTVVSQPFHPILDAGMTDDSVWYPIFVARGPELREAIIREYTRLKGAAPHDELIRHYLYRACAERARWMTMRRALAEQG